MRPHGLVVLASVAAATEEVSKGCYRQDMAPEAIEVKGPLPYQYLAAEHIPSHFDWRDPDGTGHSLLTPILNQHMPKYCGGCWLHGGISAMNDRLNIIRGGRGDRVMLARQVVLNCGMSDGAHAGSCQGGTDTGLYDYVRQFGLPDDTCQEYDASDHECSDFRKCMNCDGGSALARAGGFSMTEKACYPVQRYAKYFAKSWGTMTRHDKVDEDMIHRMKAEIYARGPITCTVSSDPLLYGGYKPGQIFHGPPEPKNTWEKNFDHVIGIVGWGEDEMTGEKYWQARNSWGTFWGDKGWFRLSMGDNPIGVESQCAWVEMEAEGTIDNYGPREDPNLRMFASNPLHTEKEEEVLMV